MSRSRNTAAQKAKTGRAATDPRAEAIADLIFEVVQCFFRIRAFGLQEGFITDLGGTFGLIRSVALYGPLTVPQIARMRPVSRQRMQKLTDQLIVEGLVELIDNPSHLRSKLVKLTSAGDRYYHENAQRLISLVSTFGLDTNEGDARNATQIVRELRRSMINSAQGSSVRVDHQYE